MQRVSEIINKNDPLAGGEILTQFVMMPEHN
jgi:hypothetical protein